MKNYDNCNFKLTLPTLFRFDDKISMQSKFIQKRGTDDTFVLAKASLVDKLNYQFDCNISLLCSKNYLGQNFTMEFYHTKQKPLVRGSRITINILSSNGKKTLVTFHIVDSETIELENVSNIDMTNEEKLLLATIIVKTEKQSFFHESPNNSSFENNTNNVQNSQTPYEHASDIPGLNRYQKALAEEIKYLKSEGGRKYKVTNGKYLGNTHGMSSYIFDLETELFISDDAPITLVVGMEHVNGNVLMCEDFQIIILIEKNIGNTVGSAHISVEPWKLLVALNERLNHSIHLHGNMANTILTNGPSLSTTQPIETIVKGQDAVLARAFTDPVTVVWGPPGTGKSHTMSELAIRYLEKGYSVLIVSHSNVSVDGVAKKIYELLNEKKKRDLYTCGQILRYGYIRDEELSQNNHISSFRYALSKSPQLAKQLDDLQNEYYKLKHTKGIGNQRIVEIHTQIGKIRNMVKEEEHNCVNKASIIATTASKLVVDKLFEERTFDVVMFDEISMAYVLQVVCAATFAKKHLLCVGDFKQLSPIAQSPASKVLCEDLFTFLKINVNGKPYNHPWLVMLNEQRRMHPAISTFASKYIYHNLLEDYPGLDKKYTPIVESYPFYNSPMNYIDLFSSYCAASKNQDNSRYNILSAAICVCIALMAEIELDKICIIAPYAAQVRLIRAMLQDYKENKSSNIRCATVHQFQGSEGNVVLFDAVESYPGSQAGFLMSNDSDSIMRLINVALTRARGKFIATGNTRFWEKVFEGKQHTFCQLQKHILEKGKHISHQDKSFDSLLKTLKAGNTIQFYTAENEIIDTYKSDLTKAKSKIVISLPSAKLDEISHNIIYTEIIEAKKRGVCVLIKTNQFGDLSKKLQEFTWGTNNATFPITMIDDKTTWYGAPAAEQILQTGKSTTFKAVCPVFIRMNGTYTAEMIKSLTNLEYRSTDNGPISLTEKDNNTYTIINEEGHGSSGLAAYIEKNYNCPDCKKTLRMIKGKSRKTILWCNNCNKPHLLSKEDINHYISKFNIRCPQCSTYMSAGLSKMGLYVKCDNGHFLGPDKI